MEVTENTQPQQTEQQIVEQQAIERYRESQKTPEELVNELPNGYNPDGTPIEELIGGKFKSNDDLLKAYQELERKMSQSKPEVTEPKVDEPKQEVTNDAGKKVDISKFHQEAAANGKLSEASYKELESLGFTTKQVDDYIEGQQLLATTFTNKLFEKAGGQEQYNEVVAWGSQNLDKSTVDDYNNAVASGDRNKIMQIAEYAIFKYKEANPSAPKRLEGTGDAYTGMQPFPSKLEWQQATSNRLYGKDSKYTQMVDNRYLESRKRGFI